MTDCARHAWRYWEAGPGYTRLQIRFCRVCDALEENVTGKAWQRSLIPFSRMAIQLG